MDSTLTSQACTAICEHMNDDHADAILTYARVFGAMPDALSATMSGLDERTMVLSIETASGPVVRTIAFDHVLADAGDARDTLIAMARRAVTDA
jgi:putative heme iron utilization protein